MKLRLALAALAVSFAAPLSAQPAIITVQLDSAVSLMRTQGFRPEGAVRSGGLAQGQSEQFQVNLRAGVNYMIIGVCDGDCSDMDLVLQDASGNELEADRAVDDVPMVAFQPTRAGTYTVDVQMPACSVAPCAYGVRVFAGGS